MNAADADASLACLFCQRGEADIPLLQIRTRGETRWICSQHLPVLIHDPSRLVGKLPGAENIEGAAPDAS